MLENVAMWVEAAVDHGGFDRHARLGETGGVGHVFLVKQVGRANPDPRWGQIEITRRGGVVQGRAPPASASC